MSVIGGGNAAGAAPTEGAAARGQPRRRGIFPVMNACDYLVINAVMGGVAWDWMDWERKFTQRG